MFRIHDKHSIQLLHFNRQALLERFSLAAVASTFEAVPYLQNLAKNRLKRERNCQIEIQSVPLTKCANVCASAPVGSGTKL
jgi:hypothetical protein